MATLCLLLRPRRCVRNSRSDSDLEPGPIRMDCRQSGCRCRMPVFMLFSGWVATKPFQNSLQSSKRKNTAGNGAFPFCNPCYVQLRSSLPRTRLPPYHGTSSPTSLRSFNATGPIPHLEPRKLLDRTLTINMAEWTSYSSIHIPIVTKMTTRPF